MSATADWSASVCGGLAAALLDACGGEPDTAAEWVAGAYAPSWGQVASALDDLRAAREHLSALITAATPCEGCGSPAGIGCAFDCDPDAGERVSLCVDCVGAAYGSDTPPGDPDAVPLSKLPGHEVTLAVDAHGDARQWFSWGACDGCDTRLGGDRYPATVWARAVLTGNLTEGARCGCVCRCTYRLDGYAPGETLCGACLDNCSQDMAVPCEICGARAGFLCPCVTA